MENKHWETEIMPCEVTRFIIEKSVFIKTTVACFSIGEIGDRLFFTEAEAEARLAELKGE